MKKLFVLLMAMLVACTLAFSLVGCGEHEHVAGDEWKSDATHHWHVCTEEGCEEQLDKAEHAYGDWKVSAEKHWKECECGAVADEAAHVDANADGKCDGCATGVEMVNGQLVAGGDILDGNGVLPEINL